MVKPLAFLLLLVASAFAQDGPEVYQTFTGRLVIAVDDFEKASAEAKRALPPERGMLETIETSRTKDDLDEIYIKYRVRADYIDELLAAVASLGELIVEDTELYDVTRRVGELRDEVEARTTRVRELEERSGRSGLPMEERIRLQRELTRESSELERASGALARLLADTETYPVELTLVEGSLDSLTVFERVLFTILLPGLALLVAAFFLGRLAGGRRGGKND